MPTLTIEGQAVELNEEGFLAVPACWNAAVAEALARHEEGLETLTPDHWKVIDFIRGFYVERNMAPMVRKVCQASGFTLKRIYELFPSGPAKGACKLAGLPKPDGCV
ncbi:MAG: TusE/DsrC/DsvC family sulfur relay protein [Candidatus Aminicenantes bacterium]|nr:TusE/DsrC/DsvC family sulfur relay protein [Candidatus Aminicenantes bacterium]